MEMFVTYIGVIKRSNDSAWLIMHKMLKAHQYPRLRGELMWKHSSFIHLMFQ